MGSSCFRKIKYLKLSKHFTSFLFIGGFNTLVCMLVFWLFSDKLKFNYLLSSGIMNIFGIIEGYILNAKFLYKTKLKFKELLKYFNVYAIAFILNLLLMYLFVSILGVQKICAQILTTGILTLLNYQIVKLFVFRKK